MQKPCKWGVNNGLDVDSPDYPVHPSQSLQSPVQRSLDCLCHECFESGNMHVFF